MVKKHDEDIFFTLLNNVCTFLCLFLLYSVSLNKCVKSLKKFKKMIPTPGLKT